MATPISNAVALTGNPLIDGLLQGSSWQFGATRVLTYSLSVNDTPNGGPWTDSFANAVRAALTEWSNVANLHFVELGSGTVFTDSVADIAITLMGSDLQESFGALGFGVFPSPVFVDATFPELGYPRVDYPRPEGDVFFDNYYSDYQFLYPSGIGFTYILHEIGHALGLKHSFDDGENQRPTFAQLGIASSDNTDYTVMSNKDPEGHNVFGNPATPMPLDILAIQHLYGANTSYHAGNDTYYLYSFSTLGTIWDAGGIDTLDVNSAGVGATVDLRPGHYSAAGLKTAIAYNVTIENAIGSRFNDSIIGNDADNMLDGREGVDWLEGGKGNDTYVVDAIDDTIVELTAGGTDTVRSSIRHILGANVENLSLTGTVAIEGTGNELNNEITGNVADNLLVGAGGDDWLDGAGGFDTMRGGPGNDTYIVAQLDPSSAPTILQARGEPGAWVLNGETVSFTPGDGQFTYNLQDFTGDGLVDFLSVGFNNPAHWFTFQIGTRNLGQNLQPGSYPNAQRWPFESAGHPALDFYGDGRGSNQVFGNFTIQVAEFDYSGHDPSLVRFAVTFEHHSESPTAPAVFGTFRYNYALGAISPEPVIELANEGNDTVRSSLTYTLPAHVENLTLTGDAAIDGTGNELANVIVGNAANNVLSGGDGADTLDGAAGADTVIGGAGNDIYIVDNAGDAVTQNENAGTDSVNSSVTYALAAHVENLTLTGAGNINGTGNTLGNVIVGNGGANTLDGGAGVDILIGGAGNDIYIVDNAGDAVTENENEGTDLVQSSLTYALAATVENLTLAGAGGINGTGNALGNVLVGNGGANTLDGGAGADTLDGGAGADTLIAGAGNDTLIGGLGLDTAVFSGASSAYTIARNGATTTVSGPDGTDMLTGIERLQFSDALTRLSRTTLIDPNGDGKSDILFRNNDGSVAAWLMNGTQISASARVGDPVPLTWNIADGHGDFNGDGKSDILWHSGGGQIVTWEMNGTQINATTSLGVLPLSWSIVDGHGDYNGDGKSDILLRNSSGQIVTWEMNGTQINAATSLAVLPSDWGIVDEHGDYNGDGKSDILLRNSGTGQIVTWEMNGTQINAATSLSVLPLDWGIVDGHGDYNGDGKSDILLRNSGTGQIVTWEMNGTQINAATSFGVLPADWGIVDAHGDYNGDGKSDILWRNSGSGQVVTWEMNGTQLTAATSVGVVPLDWSIVDGHGDFNGDGKSDILWRNNDGTVVTWQMNGTTHTDTNFGVVPVTWTVTDGAEAGAALNGNSANNIISGTVGRDTLNGAAGNDTLTGGAGADQFAFDTALNAATNVDTLTDFKPGSDKLLLSDVIFAGPAQGSLAAGNFVAEAGAVAHDGNDFILYNTSTGAVSYDADGSGAQAAVLFATLLNSPLLAASDVQIGLF